LRIPNSSSRSLSPYKSLGYAEFDPFNVIHLSRDDQNLLHHCEFIKHLLFSSKVTKEGTNVYAFQAFGQPKDPTFHPLSNLFVLVDLSDQASTHATLAHAASHLAYLDGKLSSISALFHKSAAIKLINESLNDPKAAVSDGVLAAVLRLLTLEVRKSSQANGRNSIHTDSATGVLGNRRCNAATSAWPLSAGQAAGRPRHVSQQLET
jgi:hypothetical protein